MAKFCITLAISFLFGAVLVVGFDRQAAIAEFMAKVDSCKQEVGAKNSDVEELTGKKAASSIEGRCLRLCLMKQYEVMDNKGKFISPVAIFHAEKYTKGDEDKMRIIHEIIDICAGIDVAADPCEAAEQYGKCFMEQASAHGIKDEFELDMI